MGIIKLFEDFKKWHSLSGIVLLLEDKILLVHPRKFRKNDKKWSIPKGHVEGGSDLVSALKELKEETGITISSDPLYEFNYDYVKNKAKKDLKVFVYRFTRDDIGKYLKKAKKREKIRGSLFNKKEIYQARFFTIDEAEIHLEKKIRGLLGHLK